MSMSSSTWLLSLKLMLVSTSVVSIAMIMKVSVPLIVSFAVYEVPSMWSALISWLRPPYLYVIINGIIITIAATSRYHQRLDDNNQSEPLISPKSPPSDISSDFAAVSTSSVFRIVETPTAFDGESRVSEIQNHEENEFVISRSTWTPTQRMKSPEIQTENISPATAKPLVSSRFGHRKPLKASPEGGRALRVAKPKRQETLENTWRTITDGRHVPLTRHLRKCDTWDNQGRRTNAGPQDQRVMKSETFKDRTNYSDSPISSATSSPGSGKLRKEASLSQDELNRRVEAFIKKFNEEMRLQRQESFNQYKEMINRGAH